MNGLGGQVWAVLATIAGVGLLAVLHAMTASLRNEVLLHDWQVRVSELRQIRLERIREMHERAAERAKARSAA